MAEQQRDIELVCVEVYGPLVQAMMLYTADRMGAEDAAHEALVRLVIKLGDGARIENPGGWAYRVAVNHVNSVVRRRRTAAALRCREGTVRALTHQAATALRTDVALDRAGS